MLKYKDLALKTELNDINAKIMFNKIYYAAFHCLIILLNVSVVPKRVSITSFVICYLWILLEVYT